MSKIEIAGEPKIVVGRTRAEDIPIGEVFFGSILGASIYLRTFAGIVDLCNPHKTWDGMKMTVDHYRPATSAVLTVT
jgi:hypothetical protein